MTSRSSTCAPFRRGTRNASSNPSGAHIVAWWCTRTTSLQGFGAEITATLAVDAFLDLDAPPRRLAMPDVPSPHSPVLLDAVVPAVDEIAHAMTDLLEF